MIFDVTCAWDPLVPERESEKREKYHELAADYASVSLSWKVSVHPLVVGDLGIVGNLRSELVDTSLFDLADVNRLVCEMQAESLCAAIQIIRRHFREVK